MAYWETKAWIAFIGVIAGGTKSEKNPLVVQYKRFAWIPPGMGNRNKIPAGDLSFRNFSGSLFLKNENADVSNSTQN
jgi:hypothetical protein